MVGLAITLLLGFSLRIVGFNWDQGLHLHPDERMLIMVADKIQFFQNLNPHFFNYGSLPIYLVSLATMVVRWFSASQLSNYDLMLYVGRGLSLSVDLGCIILLYKLGGALFRLRIAGLCAGCIYAISFFPIQNTHFFIVDTFLNFFILAFVYRFVQYYTNRSTRNLLFLALPLSAALATKFTAVMFVPIALTIVILLELRAQHRWGAIVIRGALFTFTTLLFTAVFMPYAFIDWRSYIHDVAQQLQLNSNPYAFPYTLQYVASVPYLYHLQNILFWGLGPVIATLSIYGGVGMILERRSLSKFPLIILCTIYGIYFAIIGSSSVKFMRYMLPLYPLFALFGGYAVHRILTLSRSAGWIRIVLIGMFVAAFSWTLMFNALYTGTHTRIEATKWILQMIPEGSTIAVEHWDDRLPLVNAERYHIEELQLYNQPDNTAKWIHINQQLARTDYIIIASNRLYGPLQRLTDCAKYKVCYPSTAAYYRDLFGHKLRFRLVQQFTVSPTLRPFGIPISIDDHYADESFTVYDHPTIFIFQKL